MSTTYSLTRIVQSNEIITSSASSYSEIKFIELIVILMLCIATVISITVIILERKTKTHCMGNMIN
ncbi:MAG: hypothetical protein QXD50_01345 [Desulfurococcaceae archaeon]